MLEADHKRITNNSKPIWSTKLQRKICPIQFFSWSCECPFDICKFVCKCLKKNGNYVPKVNNRNYDKSEDTFLTKKENYCNTQRLCWCGHYVLNVGHILHRVIYRVTFYRESNNSNITVCAFLNIFLKSDSQQLTTERFYILILALKIITILVSLVGIKLF